MNAIADTGQVGLPFFLYRIFGQTGQDRLEHLVIFGQLLFNGRPPDFQGLPFETDFLETGTNRLHLLFNAAAALLMLTDLMLDAFGFLSNCRQFILDLETFRQVLLQLSAQLRLGFFTGGNAFFQAGLATGENLRLLAETGHGLFRRSNL